MNSSIVEPLVSQKLHVPLDHPSGSPRELDSVSEHRPVGFRDLGLHEIGGQRPDQCDLVCIRYLFDSQQPTETRSVMVQSVVALIGRRDDNRDHLPLNP